MKYKKTLLATLMALPCISYADVTIDIPRGVQLLTVNGEDAGYSSLGFDYKDNLVLKNGVNQIVFRLSHIVRESGKDKTKFKSEPLVATFDEDDVKLSLKIPRIDTFDQGLEFNSDPKFSLETSANLEPKSLKKDQISIGFKLMPDMVQEVEKYNMSTEVASLKNFKETTYDVKVTDITQESSYDVLRNAYENATSEEKKKFLTWAISNFN